MSFSYNDYFANDKPPCGYNLLEDSPDDASSVYMEERYTEVVTRKFRGGKSWMVGCETFYTTKRTENPCEEKRNSRHQTPRTHQEIETRYNKDKPNDTNNKDKDTRKKEPEEVNVLARPEVYGGARPDVLVMKWRELPVMPDEKDCPGEGIITKNVSTEVQINDCSSTEMERARKDDGDSHDTVLIHSERQCGGVKDRMSPLNVPRQKHRGSSAVDKKMMSPRGLPKSEYLRRGVRFCDERHSENGPSYGDTENSVLGVGARNKGTASRRHNLEGYPGSEKTGGHLLREDTPGKFNISKKLSIENWLKNSMRYKTHDRFKYDIAGVDFVEVNRLPHEPEPVALPKRSCPSVQGGHSNYNSGCTNLYSSMFSSRDAPFREGPSGRGHFARVFADNNNEDFFLCASVFLFGHANLNAELREVIELFSHQLHVRYPRNSVGPVTGEERQILSFASMFTTKVEALVRMSSDEYYWKAFDPPGVSRPSRTLHLYYYASNYCDLIVKRDLSEDLSWECD